MISDDDRKMLLDILAQSKKPVPVRDLISALKAAAG